MAVAIVYQENGQPLTIFIRACLKLKSRVASSMEWQLLSCNLHSCAFLENEDISKLLTNTNLCCIYVAANSI